MPDLILVSQVGKKDGKPWGRRDLYEPIGETKADGFTDARHVGEQVIPEEKAIHRIKGSKRTVSFRLDRIPYTDPSTGVSVEWHDA